MSKTPIMHGLKDTRRTRQLVIIGLGAGLGAVLTERFLKPVIEGMVKK